MFTQKYHKQLLSLLPLVQQQGQQQSVQPSNKYNSNDEQQCEEQCFTPNYNVVQDQQEKKCQGKEEEEYKGDESDSRYRSSENYRMMRENGLDYQKWMRRGFDLGDNIEQKSVVIRDQKMMGSGQYENMGHHQGNRSVGYQKEHKLSPSLSSFQNLIDSGLNSNTNNDHVNINKSIVFKQQQPQLKIQPSQCIQPTKSPISCNNNMQKEKPSIKIYEQITLSNGDPLNQEMLKNNSNLRLQLITELISLLNLGHETQIKNTANCLTQVSQPQYIISFSVIPVQSTMSNQCFEQLCQQNQNDRLQFLGLQKMIEDKCAQVIDMGVDKVKDEKRKRERKQVLSSYGFKELTGKQFGKYEQVIYRVMQKGLRSLDELQGKVNRRFNQYRSKISQQYRSQSYQLNLPLQHMIQSLQTLSNLIQSLKSEHQTSINILKTFYSTEFKQLQRQVQILSQKIASSQYQLEQKLELIGQSISKTQFERQPDQGETSMLQLIKELQKKVGLSNN